MYSLTEVLFMMSIVHNGLLREIEEFSQVSNLAIDNDITSKMSPESNDARTYAVSICNRMIDDIKSERF